MTNDELEAVRARAEAATPGPWRVRTNRHPTTEGYRWGWVSPNTDQNISLPGISGMQWQEGIGQANAAFIAHARTDIPALLDEVARLRSRAAPDPCEAQVPFDTPDGVTWFPAPLGSADPFDRATRAEAHAERLAGALEGVLPAPDQWPEKALRNTMAPGTVDRITEARQALSTYNQRTET